MEKKTMGSFMAALRKANGFTQQQIADKLNVSNKTVSKWECDDGYPEISMLPAIAELYGVTVDELLRGEKATQTAEKETNTQKTQEQIKYLCDKSFSKFNNGSIIALSLCVFSFIVALMPICIYSLGRYFHFHPLAFAIVAFVTFALSVAAVVIILIAFNNLITRINGNVFLEKQIYYKKLSKCINLVSVTVALAIAGSLSLVSPLYLNVFSLWYTIPIFVFCFIIGFLVRFILCKKYDVINFDISPEKQKYRKKYNKIAAIVILSVMIFNIVFPFIGAYIDSLILRKHCFADGVGYQYETEAEAEREYYKFKDHITEEKEIYEYIDEGFDEITGKYYMELQGINYDFNHDSEKGYSYVSMNYTSSDKVVTFATEKEKEIFKQENVDLFSGLSFEELDRNVKFDDETLTISYRYNFSLSGVYDVAPVFILIASCEILVVFIISAIIYKRKTKNL